MVVQRCESARGFSVIRGIDHTGISPSGLSCYQVACATSCCEFKLYVSTDYVVSLWSHVDTDILSVDSPGFAGGTRQVTVAVNRPIFFSSGPTRRRFRRQRWKRFCSLHMFRMVTRGRRHRELLNELNEIIELRGSRRSSLTEWRCPSSTFARAPTKCPCCPHAQSAPRQSSGADVTNEANRRVGGEGRDEAGEGEGPNHGGRTVRGPVSPRNVR